MTDEVFAWLLFYGIFGLVIITAFVLGRGRND